MAAAETQTAMQRSVKATRLIAMMYFCFGVDRVCVSNLVCREAIAEDCEEKREKGKRKYLQCRAQVYRHLWSYANFEFGW